MRHGTSRCIRSPTPITPCCPKRSRSGPVPLFETLIPRQLEIIYEINRRFLDDVRRRFPGDAARVGTRQPDRRAAGSPRADRRTSRWSGSHSTNGVAALHSESAAHPRTAGLRRTVSGAVQQQKTNGVTPRRWLQQANPALSKLITETIGDE